MRVKRAFTEGSKSIERKDMKTEVKQNIHIQRSQQTILDHQILRIIAHQKQTEVAELFKKNQKELCDYFIKYRPTPFSRLKISNMTNSQSRLIKNTNKIYFGGFENKQRKGEGILITVAGKIYEGQFQDNLREGFGVEIYQNGNVYIGNFVKNKKHGDGQFYWFNISPPVKADAKFVEYYAGHWWGNYPDGKGSHQKASGNIYDGYFKNGLKHGKGEQYFYNGDSYKGDYINGMPQGFGQYFWNDGSMYEGDFKQGLRCGHGVWFSANKKQRYIGQYSMDKKKGFGEFTWKEGKYVYKGYFENDVRHGFGELYIDGYQEYQGQWFNGERLHKVKIDHKSVRRYDDSQRSQQKQQKNQKTRHKSHNFEQGMKLKPPSSAIIKRLQIPSDPNATSSSFVRSYQKPSNSGVLIRSHTKINKKSFDSYSNTGFSSDKEKPSNKRPKSNYRREPIRRQTEPTYELLVKNCNKKNCGCNTSIPLGNGLLFRQKMVKSFQLKGQQKVNNFL